MTPFRFVSADSISQACSLLESDADRSMFVAGGTDLLSEIKEGVANPATLVSLANTSELSGIEVTPTGLNIGAFATVTQIAGDPEVAQRYPALAQAAASVATPQIRNVGTLGGNLCQRPRCWYYRSRLFDCRKKGGAICFAVNGSSKYHAILGGADCFIVHPSDLAVALISMKAEAHIFGPEASRSMPLEEFFVGPEANIMAETVLQPGEILTGVSLPKASPSHRSVFLKARERRTQDFALASVAAAIEVSDGIVQDARITLGGVAPVPLRVRRAEDAATGKPVAEVNAHEVGEIAVADARPMRDNHFKVSLSRVPGSGVTRVEGLDEERPPRHP